MPNNDLNEVESLQLDLKNALDELAKYKQAYQDLAQEHSNLWAIYSNTVDYMVTQTQVKPKKVVNNG